MAASPKVTSATVGAAFSTIVVGILGPHVFPHALAPDVQGLIAAAATAAVTFGSGWFARDVEPKARELADKAAPVVKAVDTVYTRVEQAPPPVEEVAKVLEATVAHVTLPVAQALPR